MKKITSFQNRTDFILYSFGSLFPHLCNGTNSYFTSCEQMTQCGLSKDRVQSKLCMNVSNRPSSSTQVEGVPFVSRLNKVP